MPDDSSDRLVIIVLAFLSVLVLLYSLLIARQPLFGVFVSVLLVIPYFAWRFIRALERIADALEAQNADR